MDNNILILKEKSIALELDEKKKLVYFYHYSSKEVEHSSKSILLTIDSESMKEINEYFDVDIQEYDVIVDDAPRRELSKEDKKKIYTENFWKYIMLVLVVISLYMINTDDIQPEGLNYLGFLPLFGVSLVLILILGKEAILKDKITTKLKYNITTKPLPTKEEQLEILEDKIDTLLKEKENK